MGWKMDAKLYPLACEATKQMMAREESIPEPEKEKGDVSIYMGNHLAVSSQSMVFHSWAPRVFWFATRR